MIQVAKPMDRDTEMKLMRMALRGCVESRNEIIETMIPWVFKTAKQIAVKADRTDVEDLAHVGIEKIVTDFWRFDPSTGNRALTYFGVLARRAIQDEIKFNRLMRLPGSYYTNEDKLKAARKSTNIMSFSNPAPSDLEGGSDFGSILPDRKAIPVDESVETSQQVKDLLKAMKKIPPRERQIIEMRMRGETLGMIGEKMRPKITKERVRQLEARGKCRIKAIMTGESPDKNVFRRTRKTHVDTDALV